MGCGASSQTTRAAPPTAGCESLLSCGDARPAFLTAAHSLRTAPNATARCPTQPLTRLHPPPATTPLHHAATQPARGFGDPNNRRVRGVAPFAEPQPLTASQLGQKRAVFWESQTSGRPLVWSNLRVAADAMLAGACA